MIAIGSLRSRKFKNLLGVVKDENGRRRRGMEYVKIIRNYLNYFHKINILNDNFLIQTYKYYLCIIYIRI